MELLSFSLLAAFISAVFSTLSFVYYVRFHPKYVNASRVFKSLHGLFSCLVLIDAVLLPVLALVKYHRPLLVFGLLEGLLLYGFVLKVAPFFKPFRVLKWQYQLCISISVGVAVCVHISGFIVGSTSQEWKHSEVWSRLATGLLTFGGCLFHLSMGITLTVLITCVIKEKQPQTWWEKWIIPFVHFLVGCTSIGSAFVKSGKTFFFMNCAAECFSGVVYFVWQFRNVRAKWRKSKWPGFFPLVDQDLTPPPSPVYSTATQTPPLHPPAYSTPTQTPPPSPPPPAYLTRTQMLPPVLPYTPPPRRKPYFPEVLDLMVKSGLARSDIPDADGAAISNEIKLHHTEFTPTQQRLLVFAWFSGISKDAPGAMDPATARMKGKEFYQLSQLDKHTLERKRVSEVVQTRINGAETDSELEKTFAICQTCVETILGKNRRNKGDSAEKETETETEEINRV